MGTSVPFVLADFTAMYPEFGTMSQQQGAGYFAQAQIYWRNDGTGPVSDPALQATLLYMLVAHVARLNALNASGQPANPLVGRINSAAEGSVNVSVEYNPTQAQQWFAQTPYGADFWQATAAWRASYYRPKLGRFSRGRF